MPVKHIAFIVKYFPTVSETFIVNQINSLIASGYSVSLYAYHKGQTKVIHESLKTHKLIDRVQYFIKPPKSKLLRLWVFLKWTLQHLDIIQWKLFFKCLNIIKYGKDAYTLKLFFEAQWFLVPFDFELIHAHFGMNGERMAYLKAKDILPKTMPLVTTFHGYDLEPQCLQDYRINYANLFKQCNAFTVNTPYLEGLLQQVNTLQKPCYILPVGLDTAFFKRDAIKKENGFFDIVFCGRFINWKGPDTAIDILKQLHNLGHTQVRLHLIGDGEMRQLLEALVLGYELQDAIIFYGALSQEAIKGHFEQADVFLLPGRYDKVTGRAETQGLVIQEAQAMELPVVVSNVGGMTYGLLPNESGFVVDEGDINAFVNAVEMLINQQNLKKDMGIKGSSFVRATYDYKFLTEKLLEIYNNAKKET